MMAAMFGRTSLVELLLRRGADPHARDIQGLSVAQAARLMGASEAAELLERQTGQVGDAGGGGRETDCRSIPHHPEQDNDADNAHIVMLRGR